MHSTVVKAAISADFTLAVNVNYIVFVLQQPLWSIAVKRGYAHK